MNHEAKRKKNKARTVGSVLQKARAAGSHVLDVHGVLRPVVRVQGEGVVVGTVDVGQHERFLVLRLRVQGGDVVSVCIVDELAEERWSE